MELIDKLRGLIGSLRRYWRTPPPGRYMPNREIAALSFGGIGVRLIVYCFGQLNISVGNTLIGNTIGIDPTAMYAIYTISLLSGFPLTALRARMIDNTRSMKGKYRPYLIKMGIPTVVLGAAFVLMPYERMTLFMKCAVVLAFNIAFQFFFSFFNDAYSSLINVLSPNSIERSDVLSIRSVIENLSPSIVSILFPLLAKAITGEDTLFDLKIYRILYPPMLFLGLLLSIIVYANTEEKIVQARSHYIQVRFLDAFRAVARNKYFWIVSLAGWIGFLEGAFAHILEWMYHYQGACSAEQYALVIAISGNASFWPNLIAPFLIRRFGKKKILITTNLMNIGFIALMLPVVRLTGQPSAIWVMLGFIFVNQLITSLGHLLGPSIDADIRDYQQFITGERIDGMFAAVGLIGNAITMVTGLALPAIYERAGLNRSVALSLGFDGSNVYDVLYNSDYFMRICSVLIVASMVGAALNVIPYFFFDLTEAKQKAMVRVLKLRALIEDRGNGALTAEDSQAGTALLRQARENAEKQPLDLRQLTAAVHAAKSREEKRTAKTALREARAENDEIAAAAYIRAELERYETPAGKAALAAAQATADAGLDGFLTLPQPPRETLKALPQTTAEEKAIRADALRRLRAHRQAQAAAAKYYPDGIVPFDTAAFDALFAREDAADAALRDNAAAAKAAKERGDLAQLPALREEAAALRRKKQTARKEIKAAAAQNSAYHRAAKPYLDALRTLQQAKDYEQLRQTEGFEATAAAE